MKWGVRKPSLKKRVSARTSVKRIIRHNLGFKAPKGMGIFTKPKKAFYNKIYNKTTINFDDLFKGKPLKCSACGRVLKSERTKEAGLCSYCLK